MVVNEPAMTLHVLHHVVGDLHGLFIIKLVTSGFVVWFDERDDMAGAVGVEPVSRRGQGFVLLCPTQINDDQINAVEIIRNFFQ